MLKRLVSWKYAVLAVLLAEFLLLLQLKFTAWPEMTLWPYLMLKGWLPYKDIAIAHNPLLLILLASFYKVFGLGLLQLKIFTWSLILLTCLATYLVSKKLWDQNIALLALIFSILFNIYYDANGLWFDLALAPLFLLTFYFTYTKKYKLAGILWILSFLVKQTAVFILIPVLLGIGRKKFVKKSESLLFGILLIFVPFILFVWLLKILPDYSHWAFGFAGSQLPFSQGQVQLPTVKQLIGGFLPFIILLPVIILKDRKYFTALLVWAFFAGLGVYPRWEMFHILPSTPFFAIIFALFINKAFKSEKQQKILMLFGVLIFTLLTLKKTALIWHRETRFFEPDFIAATEFIRENTSKNDKILVLNYWDHVYALTDTLPATRPWVPQFPWYLGDPGVQEKMLLNIITNQPKYVVFHPYASSGLDAYRPSLLADYVEKYYQPVRFYDNFEILEKR